MLQTASIVLCVCVCVCAVKSVKGVRFRYCYCYNIFKTGSIIDMLVFIISLLMFVSIDVHIYLKECYQRQQQQNACKFNKKLL